jgi:protein-tyrosine phosphatase
MAEGAFRAACERAGLACEVDSAGTASYHIGEPPDPRAIATAKANGVDISQLLARQLIPDDFQRFSHIFALDKANYAGIRSRAPQDPRASINLLMDAVEGQEGSAIMDPYHGEIEDFELAWRDIETAVSGLVERFCQDGAGARFG